MDKTNALIALNGEQARIVGELITLERNIVNGMNRQDTLMALARIEVLTIRSYELEAEKRDLIMTEIKQKSIWKKLFRK